MAQRCMVVVVGTVGIPGFQKDMMDKAKAEAKAMEAQKVA